MAVVSTRPAQYTEADLHDYQRTAVAFLKGHPTAALMMDMGLGKTACVLQALEPRHLPAFVVAPKRVAEKVWSKERSLWRPDLSISLAVGDKTTRAEALRTPADITVIGLDNIKDLNDLKGRGAWPWRTMVIDELSKYRSTGSRQQTLGRHRWGRPRIENVWGLTGTPAPNGYLDLWPQMALLDMGKRLGVPFSSFRSRFFYPSGVTRQGVVYEWSPFPESHGHIKRLLEDMCLSMSADDYLDLPPMTVNEVGIDLPPDAMRVYRHMARELAVDLEEIFGGGAIHTAANSAVLTQKLTQISAGFIYPDDRDLFPDEPASWIHDRKIKALDEIVENTGENLLVFYAYQEELAALRAAYPHAKHIDDPGAQDEWDAGTLRMMLAHPAGAGHGLNLQYGGHHIVWTTLTWDLELWLQANGRLHRQGQQHPVIIHVLMADGTIESLILGRLREKDTRQVDLLAHFSSPI
jgi:hypothetical protein